MRGHKHNGGVYQAIAESLTDAGIPRTRAQVHNKIDNLTQTFRCKWEGLVTEHQRWHDNASYCNKRSLEKLSLNHATMPERLDI
ncbi:hypothetical protein HPB52_003635 [Rhipicephalus sanguineus]|uniref:Myb/SANT-like DNA-binding domain-containing protein n=1 Tax=Rhipicephalus sanguineus TaxID=34632 RepID=A0A9D4SN65_RHISA|nr:hypothetical protein HPB52_003635 [Rhipicephalus sanguineus]